MATIKELRDERLRKLNLLTEMGINPYPAKVNRSCGLVDIKQNFADFEAKLVTVAGRISNIRKFGQITFVVIRDFNDQIQLFLSKDNVQPRSVKENFLGFSDITLLDSGDFVEATGKVIKTKTGEISIEVKTIRLLVKSLRSLPLKQEGFSNKEERYRRRYVDMNVNEEVRQRFVRRSIFWQATREFLNKQGFIEVNVPVLEHTTGGADANPFVTHMDSLDQDLYLRISHELPLKRLLGGGFEKVYDIGPRFRNEEFSDEHLPEHVAMEWYWAFADWQDGIKLQTALFKFILNKTFNSLRFKIRDFDIDLNKTWDKIDYAQAIQQQYGLDIFKCDISDVRAQLDKYHLEVKKADNKARGIDKLWKNIRKDIAGPAWLINTPTFISPLAKKNEQHPEITQRFQAVIAGTEISNGFSELNDPIEQYNRFIEQQKMRDNGDNEAMMLDIDFVEMLEYGMPPACGLGFSERVFWLFENVTAKDGVPFPTLRYEVDATSRQLYPEAKL